jgi:phosphoribosylaminoimidazolecarboxamide formyltransferase/IMP cyclohydrolase
MPKQAFTNALVSASDKSGLAAFFQPLAAQGTRVVSTGGTAKHLRESGVSVVEVAEQTGFPEVMGGRVRTLHPSIHMPLLARARDLGDMELLREHGLAPFDLVVVNLYPFAQALAKGLAGDELIEEIDIGGPSLLRAAAKNFERIAVVCEPEDYAWILARAQEGGQLTLEERRKLAAKAFAHCSRYDALIAKSLDPEGPGRFLLAGAPVASLRYGENPAQSAWWLKSVGAVDGLHAAEILHGKPLSYNNILDLDAATSTCREFEAPCAVAVKHNNPCGVGVGVDARDAVALAVKADPTSVFGGIVACNRPIDADAAREMGKIFLECVVAPDFTEEALAILKKKKDLRLLRWPGLTRQSSAGLESRGLEFRTVAGGFLTQVADVVEPWSDAWKIVGADVSDLAAAGREAGLAASGPNAGLAASGPNAGLAASGPNAGLSAAVRSDLELGWKVCAHLKSNAIAIVEGGRTVGLGMGQVNRVDAVEQAIARMRKHAPEAQRAVLASDAFFPFADSIEAAAAAGIKWVIQPGGSIRDGEVVARARELGVSMVLTGARHFRH